MLAPFLVRELLGSDARAGGSEEVQGARAPTSLEHKTDSGVVEAGDVEVRSTLQPESNANDNSSEVKASTTQKPEAPKPGEGQIDVKDATPKPSSGGELLGSSNGSASTDAVRGGGMLTTEDESSVSWDSVDQNAIIRKNEGVWHAIKRQIQADPEIRRALNLSNNPSNDEINRATAKLLVQHEYIKPDGSEVRVLKADVVAYDAKVMDGKVVINELHSVDGKVAKGTTGIDKAFEYSYKKPVNESFGGSDLRDIGYDLEEVGMIENKQGNIIVGLDTDGESDSLLIYGVQKGEVSRLELSDGIGVEDEFMVADRIKSFSDMDSANEFIDQVRESGYVSGEMPVKLSELSSEQMRVFESAYNLQGFDGIGTRFSIERDVLMEFAKNYNGKTVEIMRMIEGDMGVPQGSEKLIQAARAVLAERIQNQGAGYQDLAQGMMIDEINEKGLISFLNDNYTGQKLMTPDEFDLPMSSMESAGNIAGPILDIGSPESSNVTEPVVASGGEPNLPSKSYDMIKQVFDIGDRAMNKMLSSTESFDNSLSQIGDTELKENISDSLKKFQERGRVISELEGQRLGGIPGAEDFKTISDVSDKPAREVYKSLFNLMEQEKELDQFLKQNDKEGFTRKIN